MYMYLYTLYSYIVIQTYTRIHSNRMQKTTIYERKFIIGFHYWFVIITFSQEREKDSLRLLFLLFAHKHTHINTTLWKYNFVVLERSFNLIFVFGMRWTTFAIRWFSLFVSHTIFSACYCCYAHRQFFFPIISSYLSCASANYIRILYVSYSTCIVSQHRWMSEDWFFSFTCSIKSLQRNILHSGINEMQVDKFKLKLDWKIVCPDGIAFIIHKR